jgi:hypothetical protein
MIRRSRRQDNDSPVVAPEPGALGLPTVPAAKPSRRRRERLVRFLRSTWRETPAQPGGAYRGWW